MWKVGNVQPTVTGIGGQFGFGFNIEDGRGSPLLPLSYKTREEAKVARELVMHAIEKSISIM